MTGLLFSRPAGSPNKAEEVTEPKKLRSKVLLVDMNGDASPAEEEEKAECSNSAPESPPPEKPAKEEEAAVTAKVEKEEEKKPPADVKENFIKKLSREVSFFLRIFFYRFIDSTFSFDKGIGTNCAGANVHGHPGKRIDRAA